MPNKTTVPLSRTPVYPPSAFVGFIMLTTKNGATTAYPLNRMYTANADFFADAGEHQETIATPGVTISDVGIILPLEFSRIWELKPEYWNDPSVHFGHMDRSKLFSASLSAPAFYDVLVTPSGMKEGTELFSAAMPIPAGNTDRVIEQFMRTSDYPVDEEAKYAAVYTPGMPFGINIRTGEVTKQRIAVSKPPSH